ncbi:MAG: hypothetical protein PF637_05595 [Spirochaetes bacterium]|jgi:hypothetical protein|nr:hypothetical protein [Spirochaetota bacterium]
MFIKSLRYIVFFGLIANLLALSRLEDIDKEPVGAYKSQILFGALISMGIPFDSAIEKETDFIKDTAYTFEEQEITKTVVLNHLNYSAHIFAEYIFMDHIGSRLSFGYNSVIQRTGFGKDYKNESKTLYKDFSILIGPAFHLTTRKRWDLVLIPQVGYALASYTPAPVANTLFDSFDQKKSFSDSSLIFGGQLEATRYFTNGLFISSGFAYTRQTLTFKTFGMEAPLPEKSFNNGSNNTTLSIIKFYISAGYALYH